MLGHHWGGGHGTQVILFAGLVQALGQQLLCDSTRIVRPAKMLGQLAHPGLALWIPEGCTGVIGVERAGPWMCQSFEHHPA